jgi:hypothetical protein
LIQEKDIVLAQQTSENKLPEFMRPLIWDTNFDKLDFRQYWFWVIERLLQYGRDDSIRWVLKTYSEDEIKEVVMKSRQLKKKVVTFWCSYYNLNREETKCFSNPYALECFL